MARHGKGALATASPDPSLGERVGAWRQAIGVAHGWMVGTPVTAVCQRRLILPDLCVPRSPSRALASKVAILAV
jgi:hypothetical protein